METSSVYLWGNIRKCPLRNLPSNIGWGFLVGVIALGKSLTAENQHDIL